MPEETRKALMLKYSRKGPVFWTAQLYMRKLKVLLFKMPKICFLETWPSNEDHLAPDTAKPGIQIYFLETWPSNEELSFLQLSQKLVTLLALASVHPIQTLQLINIGCMIFGESKARIKTPYFALLNQSLYYRFLRKASNYACKLISTRVRAPDLFLTTNKHHNRASKVINLG